MRRCRMAARFAWTYHGHRIGSGPLDRLRWNFGLKFRRTDEACFQYFSVNGNLVPARNSASRRLNRHQGRLAALRDRARSNLDFPSNISPWLRTRYRIFVTGVKVVV